MSVVYLLGIHLSQSEFASHEPTFLAQALQSMANALSVDHPNKVMHALQAEILLAVYFFHSGRILEGKLHLSSAVTLAFRCRLNLIRSNGDVAHSCPSSPSGDTEFVELPPPADAVEEGDRVNAFWTVFAVNNYWTGAFGFLSNISYSDVSQRIDTPWPLDDEEYKMVSVLKKRARSVANVVTLDATSA
jgi:hypothetical protein